MALEKYRKKRRFDKTPEPQPKQNKLTGKNRFVIHYHDASHLHYDLRLEVEGVLKSWAAPKGLPTRTAVKKLAVQVEDHPIDYLAFEGQIQKGQYGAGQVKIFDTGYFEPAHSNDIENQLNKGQFSFFLFGQKISMKLNLIRMRQSKNWLLLVGDEKSINPWINELGVIDQMPHSVEPMKSVLAEEPFDSSEWLFELKWDGIRAISYLDNGHLSLTSRNMIEQNFRYPELVNLGDFVLGNQVVLDGEIVAFGEDGLPSFQALQSRINLASAKDIQYYSKKVPVIYYVFDVLYWQGRLLYDVALIQRKKILESIILPHTHVQLSDFVENEGKVFFSAVKEKSLEGMMAKKKSSFYQTRRSKDWLKIKAVKTQEVVIGGYTKPRGTRSSFGALLLGVYEDSKFVYVGHVGTGFSDSLLKDIHMQMSKIEIDKPAFSKLPITNEPAHWVKPVLVAEVKFSEWTSAGMMRQPVFLGLRYDVDPREVRKEAPAKLKNKNEK